MDFFSLSTSITSSHGSKKEAENLIEGKLSDESLLAT